LCDAPWISPAELVLDDSETDDAGATTLKQSIEDAERRAILAALAENDHKITQAATALGISRKNLWQKMKRYQLEK
jgi:two-component system response regulator AtoC